ncbi:hypothetical protein [Spartinivicinus marinus]|nr:hypothetical protein [Spartinivicinus marinus]
MKYLLSFLVLTFSVILNVIFLPFRMLLSLFGVFSRSPKGSYTEGKDVIKMRCEGDVLNVNCDSLNEEEQAEFRAVITAGMDFPRYDGKVKHAYELKYVKNSKTCPRCQLEVRQYYANFIYATQVAPRVMFAPAGFFCIECPTVIIDHEMIKKGVAKEFQLQGVVGIDYDTQRQPDIFQTWNGNETIHIVDEGQKIPGLSMAQIKSHSHSNKKEKSQRRKHIAKQKQSRRKNRRKN